MQCFFYRLIINVLQMKQAQILFIFLKKMFFVVGRICCSGFWSLVLSKRFFTLKIRPRNDLALTIIIFSRFGVIAWNIMENYALIMWWFSFNEMGSVKVSFVLFAIAYWKWLVWKILAWIRSFSRIPGRNKTHDHH